MQFICTVLGESRVPIGERASLNLLNLSIPQSIQPGQRRGAERIVPTTFITGTISPSEDGQTDGGLDYAVPILVKDLSETGARVAMGSNMVLSSFKWGKVVRCCIALPEPFDSIDVPAVIHRLVMLSEEQVKRNVQLGIAFQPFSGDPATSRALAPIRRYIQWQKAGCPDERVYEPQKAY